MDSQLKTQLLSQTILYRVAECQDKIPMNLTGTPYEFIDDTLDAMHSEGLIEPNAEKDLWQTTDKGRKVRDRALALYDEILHFEVFAHVNLSIELPADISEDGALVDSDCYDPRFVEPLNEEEIEAFGTEDMRLAMIDYLAHRFKMKVPLERIIFLQMLANGSFDGENVWFELQLGHSFNEISNIIEHTFSWKTLADKDSEASDFMESIYTTGMLEKLKREGPECQSCGIPLAIFAVSQSRNKSRLTHCPNPDCNAEVNLSECIVAYEPFEIEKAARRFAIFVE